MFKDHKNVVTNVKSMMGRRFDDIELHGSLESVPAKVVGSAQGTPEVEVTDYLVGGATRLSPEEISAAILSELKRIASSRLGTDQMKAVICVPAHFNDGQREATLKAGKIAGLEVLRLLNEPTAAALAYGLMQK